MARTEDELSRASGISSADAEKPTLFDAPATILENQPTHTHDADVLEIEPHAPSSDQADIIVLPDAINAKTTAQDKKLWYKQPLAWAVGGAIFALAGVGVGVAVSNGGSDTPGVRTQPNERLANPLIEQTTVPQTIATTSPEVQRPSTHLITDDPYSWVQRVDQQIEKAYADDNPAELDGLWVKGSRDEITNKQEALKPGSVDINLTSAKVVLYSPDSVSVEIHGDYNGTQSFDQVIDWVIQNGRWVMKSS
jgi:hypothetical protein